MGTLIEATYCTTSPDSIYAVNMTSLVIDINVFVAGLRSDGGASREVLRRALQGRYLLLFGNAL